MRRGAYGGTQSHASGFPPSRSGGPLQLQNSSSGPSQTQYGAVDNKYAAAPPSRPQMGPPSSPSPLFSSPASWLGGGGSSSSIMDGQPPAKQQRNSYSPYNDAPPAQMGMSPNNNAIHLGGYAQQQQLQQQKSYQQPQQQDVGEWRRQRTKEILPEGDVNRFQWMGNDGFTGNSEGDELYEALCRRGFKDVIVSAPAHDTREAFQAIFTPDATAFVAALARTFQDDVNALLSARTERQAKLDQGWMPDFEPETKRIREGNWVVDAVPEIVQQRHIDMGDVSPHDMDHLVSALNSGADGVQVDFDDGCCPSWGNVLKGHFNIMNVVRGSRKSIRAAKREGRTTGHNFRREERLKPTKDQAYIMFRPRAWNMNERHMVVSGYEVMGPLFDFGMHMFHNAAELIAQGRGPFLYLSKVESYLEARLWNKIFVWTQQRLGIPIGTIKACVLIENVLASFQMNEILYELRMHSMGLNCGMWDYAASFVSKFRTRPDFTLPDRTVYVTMERRFMKSYRELVVQTCHKRGCTATGGMTPLHPQTEGDEDGQGNRSGRERQEIFQKCVSGKVKEMELGIDGFLVYDPELVPVLKREWRRFSRNGPNQIHVTLDHLEITAEDLLSVPDGGITADGLLKNVTVGICFLENWMRGNGHFCLANKTEDSATAEISRSQVWQWLRHQCILEDGRIINRLMIRRVIFGYVNWRIRTFDLQGHDKRRLLDAAMTFEHVVNRRRFPSFITTYLYNQHVFWSHVEQPWL
jgi:malate synthase A